MSKRPLSRAAKAAQQIRKELKQVFPNVKFSVRSRHSSVYIDWKDWPTVKAVEEVTDKYKDIDRDPATGEILLGANIYVFCSHDWTPETRKEIESRMPEGITRTDIHYFPWLNTIANELYQEKYRSIVTAPKKAKRTAGRKRTLAEPKPTPVPETVPYTEPETELEPEQVTEMIMETMGQTETEMGAQSEAETTPETAPAVNWYEERKKQRAEYYRQKAEKAREEAERLRNSLAIQTLRGMMGEPIKVGHHSERRHRRLIERADRDFEKAIEAWKKAEYYRQKAESAETNKAISSDDPAAIEKLEKKLQELKKAHERMKQLNAEYRKVKGNIDAMNISDKLKEKLKQAKETYIYGPEQYKPFPSYVLANNNARIRETENRIEELKRQQQQETTETEINGVTIIDNVEENRLQIIFDSIPPEPIRQQLKKHGFRWSPKNRAWQRYRSNQAMFWAKKIISEM